MELFNLTDKDKRALSLSYLDVTGKYESDMLRYSILEIGMITSPLVMLLFKATVTEEIILTDSQLKDLVADINYCKCNGLWDVSAELETIDLCKRFKEEKEMYEKMSNADRKAFDEMRSKAIDRFIEKAEKGLIVC